jgi:hypothetical protein
MGLPPSDMPNCKPDYRLKTIPCLPECQMHLKVICTKALCLTTYVLDCQNLTPPGRVMQSVMSMSHCKRSKHYTNHRPQRVRVLTQPCICNNNTADVTAATANGLCAHVTQSSHSAHTAGKQRLV